MQQYNILKLLQLLDQQVYSHLAETDQQPNIKTFVSRESINPYFNTLSELTNSLKFYSQTLIEILDGKVKICPLVEEYSLTEEGLHIIHNKNGLEYYLNRNIKAQIHNGAIQLLFAKAFAKYTFNGEMMYSLLSKGYESRVTPDEFRSLLQMKYQNPFLMPRVLRPAEKAIYSLFEKSLLPFYFIATLEKSVYGTGGKIIGIKFEVKDYITTLRQKRLRDHYLEFIDQELIKLFPWDFPFYRERIGALTDSIVEEIYEMLKNIEFDPDYDKTSTSFLVKYKLNQNFNITLQLD